MPYFGDGAPGPDRRIDDFWAAICPAEPMPKEPDWPIAFSRDLLVGMRADDDFVDALCRKYEIV